MKRFFAIVLLWAIAGCANPSAPITSLRASFSHKAGTIAQDTLYPIFPNPYNRSVGDTALSISFALADSGAAQVVVQNALGDQITIFSDSLLAPGYYIGSWNPLASDGTRLLNGLYFITLRNGDFIFSRLVNIQENQ